ncbi:uncharacterized protein LOC143880494 isoform X1 [Tasmannia lanceolata]|uniref:uncharacterized protein LOC143880494 isoform X1 n=1 Tax=Tasmannia lanceolata TaxID=3420 RepID=UPI0040649500
MPKSEYQKLGVNLHGRQSSDSVAGVPLKKRRFPSVRSTSPPPQISSRPGEPHLPQKEPSISPLESSSSDAGGQTKVSVTIKDSTLEGGGSLTDRNIKLVPKLEMSLGLDVQHSNVLVSAGTGEKMISEEKFFPEDRLVVWRVPENTELPLPMKEPFVLPIGEAISGEGKLVPSDNSAFRRVPGNTELLLALKEPRGLPMDGQNSGGNFQEQMKLDQHSWSLGVLHGKQNDMDSAEEQNNASNRGDVTESKADDTRLRSNRSHWDLNTMMDTWEGSMGDSIVNHPSGGSDGLDPGAICDKKPVICPTEKVLREPESSRLISGMYTPVKSVNTLKFPSSSRLPDECYNFEAHLHLRLSPSPGFQSCFNSGPVSPSTRLNSMKEFSDLSLSASPMVPTGKSKFVDCKAIKPEPNEQGSNIPVQECKLKLVDQSIVKSEPVDEWGQRLKTVDASNPKIVESRIVKSEPVERGSKEDLTTAEGTSGHLELHSCRPEVPINDGIAQEGNGIVKSQDLASESVVTSLRLKTVDASNPKLVESGVVKSESHERGSKEDLMNVEGTSGHLERHSCRPEMPNDRGIAQEGSENAKASESGVTGDKEPMTTDGLLGIVQSAFSENTNPQSSSFILGNNVHMDSRANADEIPGSDEDEKINISVEVDDPYDSDASDYESDGVLDTGNMVVKPQNDDDDFEDGEVREPLVDGAVEVIFEEGEAKHVVYDDSDNREANVAGCPTDDHVMVSLRVECSDGKTENPGETESAHCIEKQENILCNETSDKVNSIEQCIEPCLQESSSIEVPATGSSKKRIIKTVRRVPRDQLGKDGLKRPENVSVPEASANRETLTENARDDTVALVENVKGVIQTGESHANSPQKEPFVNDAQAIKDAVGRSNPSRIINLGRAPNGLSIGRTRPIPGRSFASRSERGRFTHKLHPRGSRAEGSMHVFRKFGRDRNQDQLVENSGPDFMHVRGQFENPSGTSHGDWDPDQDFNSEHYTGSTGFRFPRPKNVSAVAAAKLEYNGCVVAPDGTIVSGERPGRKLVNDELQSYRHPPSRRRGRGPILPLGMQTAHRPLRDLSPDRYISGNAPDMVALRHEENFMRGLPDEMMEPLFPRSQPQYDRVDNPFPFVRRERSFSPPMRRRGSLRVPRICSKSPPRSRTRSPCPWSSPRRISPDGFDGHPELMHCRSPPIFRVERMRSPHQRPAFAEDMMVRRHGSPPYITRLNNNIRDVGPPREHDHPRPFISHRSPSGRVLQRRTRRIDMIDPQERTESDEYFGPLRPARFHEFPGDECVDERRKGSDRRGPIRSFRPCDGDGDGGFGYHVEDGSRPYRFCPEVDEEFHERGGPRDIDGRVKNRIGNPRRPRGIEERQDNYKYGGREWQDADLNDLGRPKRGRF